MDIWKNGVKKVNIEIENIDEIKSISLDIVSVPDIDPSNNYIEVNFFSKSSTQ